MFVGIMAVIFGLGFTAGWFSFEQVVVVLATFAVIELGSIDRKLGSPSTSEQIRRRLNPKVHRHLMVDGRTLVHQHPPADGHAYELAKAHPDHVEGEGG
jgi:hypothetical protein